MSQPDSAESGSLPGNRPEKDIQDELASLDRQAKAAYQHKAFLEAAQFYQAMATIFEQNDQFVDAAEVKNNAAVAYLQNSEASQALPLLVGTPDIFASSGDIYRQAMALGNLGMALDGMGKLDEAAAAYEQSSGLFRQLGAFEERLFVLQSLSKVYFRQGKPLLAVTAMRAGINMLPNPTPRQRLLRWLLKVPDRFLQPEK